MNIREVKRPIKRVNPQPIQNLGIIGYGDNNLYPQDIRAVVANSKTGSSCLRRLSDFISGNGFNDENFSRLEVNRLGETTDDLLQLVANDMALWNGFAVHVNYNLLGQITEIYHIPFEFCRLGLDDESGYISKIATFPDWSGSTKRGNKILQPKKEDIKYYPRFNPLKEVVFAQIEAVGGIDNYEGQIFWFSSAGRQEYPTALYDSGVTYMSTEEGLANISYRNVRNNMFPGKIIVVKKGLNTQNEDGAVVSEQDTDPDSPKIEKPTPTVDDNLEKALSSIQGDNNSSNVMLMSVNNEEDILTTIDLNGKNYDKDFTVTTDATSEGIYTAYGMEIWYRIASGAFGFSTEIMRNAYDITSSFTGIQRRNIERVFNKIFKLWHEPLPTTDFKIEPLIYVSSETPNDSGSDKESNGSKF